MFKIGISDPLYRGPNEVMQEYDCEAYDIDKDRKACFSIAQLFLHFECIRNYLTLISSQPLFLSSSSQNLYLHFNNKISPSRSCSRIVISMTQPKL